MPDLDCWPTDGATGSVSSEARWRKMARGWVPSGVAMGLLDTGGAGGLVPTLAAGPTINVTIGGCWCDGHYGELTTPASIPATANGLLVVRFTPADNHMELLYRDAATTCTQTLATWELPIAQMVAGAIRDIRWFANTSGELGYVQSIATVNLAAANTVSAPLDIDTLPAIYCDGSVLEATFTGVMNVTPANGITYASLWVDNALAVALAGGNANAALAITYTATNVPAMGTFRVQPAAGVHQFRSRGWITAAATAGQVALYHSLRVRRI